MLTVLESMFTMLKPQSIFCTQAIHSKNLTGNGLKLLHVVIVFKLVFIL